MGRIDGDRNKWRMITTYLGAVALLLATTATGQEPNHPVSREDRWKFYAPNATVTDDPRRVPIAPSSNTEQTIVLRGGRIFDATGKKAYLGTLVVHGNKISGVLAPSSNSWPEDAQVIDVTGDTILPGLIDLHTHLTYEDTNEADNQALVDSMSDATLRGVERLRYFIESGITSVRDVGSQGEVPFRLKDWVNEDRIPGPRIFAAGQFITSTGGHGAAGDESDDPLTSEFYIANGADQWRQAVRVQFNRGADLIKIGSHFSREEVRAAVEEAHSLGMKITCDCETFYTEWAVEAGVDMIEHPLPRSDETIRLMAEKGVASDPTFMTYEIIFNDKGGYFHSTSRRFTFSDEANLRLVEKMKRAGVTLGVGTDLVTDWYKTLPTAYIVELKDFTKIGYTPSEALVAATRTNAELLDMGDRLGTLEPGKLADVTVVAGNPDENLDDLHNVKLVLRDGHIQVQDGRVFVERHAEIPLPAPRTK
jgi:imidazolonepropionase-like amidohydrolase